MRILRESFWKASFSSGANKVVSDGGPPLQGIRYKVINYPYQKSADLQSEIRWNRGRIIALSIGTGLMLRAFYVPGFPL